MRYMHLKNYRSIENSEFLFSSLNFLVGDNNTGKTSILKFIECIYKNEFLDFYKTYLFDYSINDLKKDLLRPIQLLYAGWSENKKVNQNHKKFMFEYIEIDNEKQLSFTRN